MRLRALPRSRRRALSARLVGDQPEARRGVRVEPHRRHAPARRARLQHAPPARAARAAHAAHTARAARTCLLYTSDAADDM
eukprot:5078050-Prymnesium_polylepis.1